MILNSTIRTIQWMGDFSQLIDQTLLPYKFQKINIYSSDQMFLAIKNMIVRGAPAIGIAGAHGIVLSALELDPSLPFQEFKNLLLQKAQFFKSARPTAVNLMWAIDKQIQVINSSSISDNSSLIQELKNNAIFLENQDIIINQKIGELGASLIKKSSAGILTHCNAGALATVGYGTALGVIRSAFANDNSIKVFADETRPRQQGARLTSWELIQDGIDVTLLTDAMCSYFMQNNFIDYVIVGADRIAANGDTANKIGTFTLAICANYHNIPFFVAAPTSTIDFSISSGEQIPIEFRDASEVTYINDKLISHSDVNVINPSFDVTPAKLISAIITEKGILYPDFSSSISNLFT